MRLPFPILLALHYLRPKRSFLTLLNIISVMGIMLIVAVIIVVMAVMSGFDTMWRDKLLGFNAHITVFPYYPVLNVDETAQELEAVEGIRAASPYLQTFGFMDYLGNNATAMIRGVDPLREDRATHVSQYLVFGHFSLEKNEMIVGAELARKLRLGVGDTVSVFSPESLSTEGEIQLPDEFTISGIFQVGKFDIDEQFALVNLADARDLIGAENRHALTGFQLMTENPLKAYTMSQAVEKQIEGVRALSWMELYQQLFAALKVEKNMMLIILIIVAGAGALLVMNTIIAVTYQKTKEIGLLKALGFNRNTLLTVFMLYGFILGSLGSILGVLFGSFIIRFRNDLLNALNQHFGWELLPESIYQLPELPAELTAQDASIVVGSVLCICLFSALWPSLRAALMDPVKALNHE